MVDELGSDRFKVWIFEVEAFWRSSKGFDVQDRSSSYFIIIFGFNATLKLTKELLTWILTSTLSKSSLGKCVRLGSPSNLRHIYHFKSILHTGFIWNINSEYS